jgi:hypothetical protein
LPERDQTVACVGITPSRRPRSHRAWLRGADRNRPPGSVPVSLMPITLQEADHRHCRGGVRQRRHDREGERTQPVGTQNACGQRGQVLLIYSPRLPTRPDPRPAGIRGTAIAYETVTDDRGGLPLLALMSEVVGRLAPGGCLTLQRPMAGAWY